MKRILSLFILLLSVQSFSQIDHNGNPIFNTIELKEDTIKNFHLLSNYYTLKNNIDSKNSSVFIAERPTLDEIENAAIKLPSDNFLITKNQSVISMILIQNYPSRKFFVIYPSTGAQKEFACNIVGDISENRANEIIKEGYDPKAKILNDKLYFNNKTFSIAYNKNIKETLLKFIEEQKLDTSRATDMMIPSKEDLKKIVLDESKEGGKLDFFTDIKGHEYDGVQIKPGLFTTKLGIALYKWGHANFDLGVNTIEDALEFWAAFKGRTANQREVAYITDGFNKKYENQQ